MVDEPFAVIEALFAPFQRRAGGATLTLSRSMQGLALAVPVSTFGRQVLLSLRDDGRGIAREDVSRIFEDGFRSGAPARPTPSRYGRNSGFGLGAVKRLVEHAGGSIAAGSQLGEGTTFRIRLPAMTVERPTGAGHRVVDARRRRRR